MSYYIKNEEKNGLEIYFDGKPDESTRELLKENKWRWYGAKKCWYNRYSEANENLAKYLCDGVRKSYVPTETSSTYVEDKKEIKKKKIDTGEDGIFVTYPDCLEDRIRLRGVLSDVLLGDKLLVNIILAAFDMGIANDIEKAKKLDDLFKGKYRKKLVDEFGLSLKNADTAIQFWLEEYGAKYLCMEVSCSNTELIEETESTETVEQPSIGTNTNTPVVAPNTKPIDIGSMAKGEKIPKALLRRDVQSEKSYGISETHISAFKGYSHDDYLGINIVGEFEGKAKFGGYAMVVVVVHNDKGEPIGMSSSVRFKPEALNGNYSFEMNVYIPTEEMISDISFRITNDPCF